jgi:membrane associated rhomboid family serine protease
MTVLLILANAAVFVLMAVHGASLWDPTSETLVRWGADFGPLTANGEWWRTVTSTFVHIGVLHLLFNMYALYCIGEFSEQIFGRFGFTVLYLLAGVGGSLTSLFWNPRLVSAGASGAIFGLYRGLLAYLLLERRSMPGRRFASLTASTVGFLAFNLIQRGEGIDMSAHIGGLVTGFFVGLLLTQSVSSATWGSRALRGSLALAVGTAVLALGAAQIPAPDRTWAQPDAGEHAESRKSQSPIATDRVPQQNDGRAPTSDQTQQGSQPADQQATYAIAIQAVLSADEALSGRIHELTERMEKIEGPGGATTADLLAELGTAAKEYLLEAGKMDLNSCPKDFREAYLAHLSAWNEVADALSSVPNQSDSSSEADAWVKRFGGLNGNVNDSWKRVQTVAQNYGAR